MSTPAQSNQTAGAGEQSCRWCSLWNIAFAAEKLQPKQYGAYSEWINYRVEQLQDHAESVLILLANRETECSGCQRSAEIYLGIKLGDKRRAWRAAMWAKNPSMRFMMRRGPSDTFQEDQA